MKTYKEYFTIDENYAPCMTQEVLNRESDAWHHFYPHDSFVKFLRTVLQTMDGGKKSVWLTGAYGTGKTYSALVLQKLFNENDTSINRFLEKREDQILEPVRQLLSKHRKNGVLAVFGYGSGGISTKEQFLVRIEQAIIDCLKERDLTIPPKGSLETIVERVSQECHGGENSHFFQTRDQIQDQLAHLNASINTFERLKANLENRDTRDGLLTDTLTVLRNRNIYLDLSSSSLLRWIADILKVNSLQKLVFIWDEFSDYIERNKGEYKTLEELAEAAVLGQFYFIPVTHMTINAYQATGMESAKKANDRFEFRQLDMPNETAFRLAAEAIQILPDKNKEWIHERDNYLWTGIKDTVETYICSHASDIETESFKYILPLHPMAAFVLKHLSTMAGSNQRSLFDYLKSNAEGAEFREFIESGGPDVKHKQYLTVDHLWKYFIERDELGISPHCRDIRAEFIRQRGLQPNEERVLKAVLLFSLLGRLAKDGHHLLQPTVENIEKSFAGDGAIHGVTEIVKDLESKHCFSVVNGRCELFRSENNSAEIEKEKERLRSRFSSLVLGKTLDALEPRIKGVKLNERFDIRVSSVDSLTNIPNKERYAPNTGNQLLIQFVLACDPAEQLRIPDKVKSLAKQFCDHRILFITMPQLTFCDDNANHWEEYIDYCAQLALANSQMQKQIYEKTIEDWNKKWNQQVTAPNQPLRGYKPAGNGESETTDLQWSMLDQYLKTFVKQTLRECVDEFCGGAISAFGTPTGLKGWALAGLRFDETKVYGQVTRPFKQNGIDGTVEWFAQNPQHPLTEMRNLCHEKLKNTVGHNTTCSLRKIYIELQRPPYGLRYVNYSAFVFGFITKEFLNQKQPLQWTDGMITKQLDADTLAEIIESVVKDDGENKIKNEKLLCRLSKEEKAFIEQAQTMFGIKTDSNANVETVLIAIGGRIESVMGRVPLWILPAHIESQRDTQSESLRSIIENLCRAMTVSAKNKDEKFYNAVREIGRLLLNADGLAKTFSGYFKPEVFETAFRTYVDESEPTLSQLAKEVNDTVPQYYTAVKDKSPQTAGWLWNETDYDAVIEDVKTEYQVLRELHPLLNYAGFLTYNDAVRRLCRNVFDGNKVPRTILENKFPATETLFRILTQYRDERGNIARELLNVLISGKDILRQVFFDKEYKVQAEILRDILGNEVSVTPQDVSAIYDGLPNETESDETAFIRQVRSVVDERNKKSQTAQIKEQWKTIEEKINSLSENEAKKLLLKLADKYPDVGFLLLGGLK